MNYLSGAETFNALDSSASQILNNGWISSKLVVENRHSLRVLLSMDNAESSKPVVVLPTIHLGGTARATLFEDTSDALSALRDALCALDVTAPNGRDYPKLGDLIIATAQHLDRKNKLESVIAELEALAEHIVA
jgi:hypothetical protein